MNVGVSITFTELSQNLISLFLAAIVILCLVLFLVGTFMMVISRGEQDLLQQGKDYMIRSIMGLSVVLGSYGILQTVYYLLY